jgi:hypothetical protein
MGRLVPRIIGGIQLLMGGRGKLKHIEFRRMPWHPQRPALIMAILGFAH